MNRAAILAAALCILPLAACSGVKGSGVNKTEPREVGKFSSVQVGGAMTLEITVGRSPSLQVSGDDNIVPLVKTEVQGDRLVIKTDKPYRTSEPLKVTLSTPQLTMVGISGAAQAKVDGLASAAFQLKISGAARAELSGQVGRLEVEGSGACKVDAVKLPAGTVMVDLSGAGKLDVNAVEKLMVKISGAASVRYKGDPQVTQEISGVGKVKKL